MTLRDVAEAAGLGLADLYRLYPDKVALVAAFMARIDAEVLAGTPSQSDPEETARDRLFDVMMRRYDALRPYRAALRRDPPRRHRAIRCWRWPWGRRCAGRWRPCWRPPRVPSDGLAWCVAAEWPAGHPLCRVAGLRPGRDGRSVEDHGGPGQPPEDGREMVPTL